MFKSSDILISAHFLAGRLFSRKANSLPFWAWVTAIGLQFTLFVTLQLLSFVSVYSMRLAPFTSWWQGRLYFAWFHTWHLQYQPKHCTRHQRNCMKSWFSKSCQEECFWWEYAARKCQDVHDEWERNLWACQWCQCLSWWCLTHQ